MEKTVKMFIKTNKGEILEQNIPEGLVVIYLEKGWKKIEENSQKPTEKQFSTAKKNKFKNE